MARVYSNARDKILDATEKVILRDGPQGVSIDAVLVESGMSKGGFFHHFPSKAALLGGLLERLLAVVAAQAAASMQGDLRRHARSLRAKIALTFDIPPAEGARRRALVLALLAGAMESPAVVAHVRKANQTALATADAEGLDRGIALCVEFALDGYFLAESFKTTKLDDDDRDALRATLLDLINKEPKKRKRLKPKEQRARR
jgi:AcrR family transcriptional regulator